MQQKINAVEGQVETMQNAPDVADIVASYDELTKYDKSSLTDKAVIKVLKDEKHSNKEAYYRYLTADNDFTFIDVNDSSYTKSETNTLLNAKQNTLVSGTNIKSINGYSILGAGNLEVNSHQGFKSGWPTNTTFQAFIEAIRDDASAIPGMTYLGELTCSGLPTGLNNAEAVVEIMKSAVASSKCIHVIVTSGNLDPYHWEYTYWNNGSNSGWIAFQPKMNAGTNISIVNNTINNTLDAYTKTESDAKYLTQHQDISGKADKATTLSGYGITDAYTKTESDEKYLTSHQDISGKADKATTLSGYGITDAYTKTESDNKYLTSHQDISNLATKNELTTGLATKQNTITGAAGEVVYHNGTSVFTQSVMNTGYAVAITEDLNACKNSAPSFSDVFNKWKKFSHRNATNDAIPSEMTAWTYDSGTDTITQPLNTESYVGFISPKSYSSYDVTVRCYSTGADDDSIGLVAAFAKDSNGLEHTLSFIRSPGGTSAKWVAILDYNQFALTGTSYGQKILVNNSAASTTPASTANWNTESIGTGTVINMVRNGNVITAKCSQFNSSTLDDSTLITIDLDALSEANPTLNLFKGASPWGYSNFSQPNSKYENISVTDPDGMIFDITNNEVLQYNPATKTWGVVSGMNPVEEVGAGRFSYNSITGKLFFCTGTEIFQVATNTNI